MILRVGRDEVDEPTAATPGSLAIPLVDGMALQHHLGPEHAPSASGMVDALRALHPG